MGAIVETFFLVLLLGWEALKWIDSTFREGFFLWSSSACCVLPHTATPSPSSYRILVKAD